MAYKHAMPRRFFGIDGEGQDDDRGRHHYNFIGVSNANGQMQWRLRAAKGKPALSTRECLDFILDLPIRERAIFAFSFGYDLTKILKDVDNVTLYLLVHPQFRQRGESDAHKGPRPVYWQGYSLNLQGTKFTVTRGKKRRVVWDIFKFFACRFTKALTDWKIADEATIAQMQKMKDERHRFNEISEAEVEAYCLSECECLAGLAETLTHAHTRAGLTLTKYYGAGSSGEAMLDKMGIQEKIRQTPEEMRECVAAAFGGGRFDNAYIGPIRKKLYSWDISSAYVYQLAFLPCLAHGKWEYTTDRGRFDRAKIALVEYDFDARSHRESFGLNSEKARWGPFPYRERDGSISYPIISGGGYVWQAEFRAAERLFPSVRFRSAWVYDCGCDCQPFADIPRFYLERLRIGKEGAGLSIKLGMNSCYGKLAQSIGSAKFNCWIWAGLVTSGTRAQLLEFAAQHKDLRNMIMIATDSILTSEKLSPPIPIDTGTGDYVDEKGKKKPLGGWELKTWEDGVFLARPGIYFPMKPSEEELDKVRARGMGRAVLLKHWQNILDHWERTHGSETIKLANVPRFIGIKTGLHYRERDRKIVRASHRDGSLAPYGQWITRGVEMSFDPMPKREGIARDGKSLLVRRAGEHDKTCHHKVGLCPRIPLNARSAPYAKALRRNDSSQLTEEAKKFIAFANEMSEQPDFDYADLDEYDTV